MIPFRKLKLQDKQQFDSLLMEADRRSCEYSFANLFLWGKKSVAEQDGFLLVESKFDRRQVYLFPVGRGDLNKALDAVIHDAAARRIECCIAALTEEDCRAFEAGMTLADGLVCQPAGLEILSVGEESEAHVTLREGKFHQVKRMLAERGKPVLYLERVKTGNLTLDPTLPRGEFRFLTEAEIQDLKSFERNR